MCTCWKSGSVSIYMGPHRCSINDCPLESSLSFCQRASCNHAQWDLRNGFLTTNAMGASRRTSCVKV